jgi:uncharacterized protein (UPF0276 family)
LIPAIGYALREQNRLIFDDPAIDAVEVTFERADDPLRVERYIGDLQPRYASIHALKLSPGSPDPPSEDYLARLKAIARENDARSISDHLGFTRDAAEGTELGHFAPVPPTQAALDATSRNVDAVMAYFAPLTFYIETIAYLFRLRGEMSEAEFLRKLLSRTGCGLLLDITNVYANARNFGFEAREFIDEVLPTAPSVQIHLAGGFFDEKAQMYIDSHSHPVPEDVWDLYRHTLRRAAGAVSAVFIERDQNFPDEAGWREEIRTARRIAQEVASEEETVLEPQ